MEELKLFLVCVPELAHMEPSVLRKVLLSKFRLLTKCYDPERVNNFERLGTPEFEFLDWFVCYARISTIDEKLARMGDVQWLRPHNWETIHHDYTKPYNCLNQLDCLKLLNVMRRFGHIEEEAVFNEFIQSIIMRMVLINQQ